MKLKLEKEVFDFLQQTGTILYSGFYETGEYLYHPFWYKVIDAEKGIVEQMNFDELPYNLTDELKASRQFSGDIREARMVPYSFDDLL